MDLTTEETAYLVALLREHLDYYRTLVSSDNCSARNRERYAMVNTLWRKLTG